MRFLIIPKPDGSAAAAADAASLDESVFAAYMRYNEEMHLAGVLVASEGLNPAGSEARVAITGGRRTVVDGPFAEAKELIGGFYVLEVGSRQEAVEWALRCPVGLGNDEVLEIHQMTELGDLPPRFQEIIADVAPEWSSSLARSN